MIKFKTSNFVKGARFTVERTPWAVFCVNCGMVYLTKEEYDKQMMCCDSTWRCPICGCESEWNDSNFDDYCALWEDHMFDAPIASESDYIDSQIEKVIVGDIDTVD